MYARAEALRIRYPITIARTPDQSLALLLRQPHGAWVDVDMVDEHVRIIHDIQPVGDLRPFAPRHAHMLDLRSEYEIVDATDGNSVRYRISIKQREVGQSPHELFSALSLDQPEQEQLRTAVADSREFAEMIVTIEPETDATDPTAVNPRTTLSLSEAAAFNIFAFLREAATKADAKRMIIETSDLQAMKLLSRIGANHVWEFAQLDEGFRSDHESEVDALQVELIRELGYGNDAEITRAASNARFALVKFGSAHDTKLLSLIVMLNPADEFWYLPGDALPG